MKKYYWNNDDLSNCLSKLRNALYIETDPDKIDFITGDIELLETILEEELKSSTKLLEAYKGIKDGFARVEFLKPYYLDFLSNDFEPIPNAPYVPRQRFSEEEILTLTHDFYKSLGSELFSCFLKAFNRRHDHFRFSERNSGYGFGYSINLQSLKESYLIVNRFHTIEDVFSTIHEYMHATSLQLCPHHFSEEKALYYEIDTYFIEFLARDFLEKQIGSSSQTLVIYYNYARAFNIASDIACLFHLSDYESQHGQFLTNKQIKNVALNDCLMPSAALDDCIYNMSDEYYYLLTSFLISIEFYSLYKKDPELAIRKLMKFIRLRKMKTEEYFNSIREMGFNIGEHTSEFETEIKSDVEKLSRERKKTRI